MDDIKFDRLESKIDSINEKIHSIDTTLAAQHESLRDHIRRTEILEEEIKPIKKHTERVSGAVAFISFLGVLAAIVETIILAVK